MSREASCDRHLDVRALSRPEVLPLPQLKPGARGRLTARLGVIAPPVDPVALVVYSKEDNNCGDSNGRREPGREDIVVL